MCVLALASDSRTSKLRGGGGGCAYKHMYENVVFLSTCWPFYLSPLELLEFGIHIFYGTFYKYTKNKNLKLWPFTTMWLLGRDFSKSDYKVCGLGIEEISQMVHIW